MNADRDLWAFVHEWRYSGKAANATDADLLRDECANVLERALDASGVVPRSRLEAVERELAEAEAEMTKRSIRAAEVTKALLDAVEKSKQALLSGEVCRIEGDMAIYRLEGSVCGNALSACRAALAFCGAPK